MKKRKQHNATMDFYSNVLQDDIKSSAYEKLFVIDRLQHRRLDDTGRFQIDRNCHLCNNWVDGDVRVRFNPSKKSTSYPLVERLKSCKVRPYVNLTLFVHLSLGETKKGGKCL